MINNKLYLVVPCYNEEEILNSTALALETKMKNLIKNNKISEHSKIMFVNDGSIDNTWQIILALNKQNKIFTGISLSRNKGHQNALLAGLLTAKNYADFTISLDADLQDDIDAIDQMIEKYLAGFNIVYGVRCDRQTDSLFKKTTANAFYKIINFLGAKTIDNHADFRLMDKKALNALEKFEEVNLFLRGIVPMIGYKSTKVFYERKKREAGISKYPLKRMIHFALDGIMSCSTKLMSIVMTLGLLMLLFAVAIPVVCTIFQFTTDLKWQALMSSIWGLCGLIMLAIALVGKYVEKTLLESKRRPRYIIAENLEEDQN